MAESTDQLIKEMFRLLEKGAKNLLKSGLLSHVQWHTSKELGEEIPHDRIIRITIDCISRGEYLEQYNRFSNGEWEISGHSTCLYSVDANDPDLADEVFISKS